MFFYSQCIFVSLTKALHVANLKCTVLCYDAEEGQIRIFPTLIFSDWERTHEIMFGFNEQLKKYIRNKIKIGCFVGFFFL